MERNDSQARVPELFIRSCFDTVFARNCGGKFSRNCGRPTRLPAPIVIGDQASRRHVAQCVEGHDISTFLCPGLVASGCRIRLIADPTAVTLGGFSGWKYLLRFVCGGISRVQVCAFDVGFRRGWLSALGNRHVDSLVRGVARSLVSAMAFEARIAIRNHRIDWLASFGNTLGTRNVFGVTLM